MEYDKIAETLKKMFEGKQKGVARKQKTVKWRDRNGSRKH